MLNFVGWSSLVRHYRPAFIHGFRNFCVMKLSYWSSCNKYVIEIPGTWMLKDMCMTFMTQNCTSRSISLHYSYFDCNGTAYLYFASCSHPIIDLLISILFIFVWWCCYAQCTCGYQNISKIKSYIHDCYVKMFGRGIGLINIIFTKIEIRCI